MLQIFVFNYFYTLWKHVYYLVNNIQYYTSEKRNRTPKQQILRISEYLDIKLLNFKDKR